MILGVGLLIPSQTKVEGFCEELGMLHNQCVPLEIPVFWIGGLMVVLIPLLIYFPYPHTFATDDERY